MKKTYECSKNLKNLLKVFNASDPVSKLTGLEQLTTNTYNIIDGCQNNCKYCQNCTLPEKKKKVSNPLIWKTKVSKEIDLDKVKRMRGPILFPSNHDITPDDVTHVSKLLREFLFSGSNFIITTKPHLTCIEQMCADLKHFKSGLIFRFSIGSADSKVLKFWEPNCTGFEERLECLKLAHSKGFKTSVSCQPMLDGDVDSVIEAVSPYVTENIFIGKVENLKVNLAQNHHNDEATLYKADQLLQIQSDENILRLYQTHKDNPLIIWEKNIVEVLDKHGVLEPQKPFYMDCGLTLEKALELYCVKYSPDYYQFRFLMHDNLNDYCQTNGIIKDWSFFTADNISKFFQYLAECRGADAHGLRSAKLTIYGFLKSIITDQSFHDNVLLLEPFKNWKSDPEKVAV